MALATSGVCVTLIPYWRNHNRCQFDHLCDSDTENDDTLVSTQSQHTAVASSMAAVRLDDIIDDDSDFEVSSKPRVSRTSQAKYYILALTVAWQ